MTIGERLDKTFPAHCHACKTPIKRVEHRQCPACGLDQFSQEALSMAWQRRFSVFKHPPHIGAIHT